MWKAFPAQLTVNKYRYGLIWKKILWKYFVHVTQPYFFAIWLKSHTLPSFSLQCVWTGFYPTANEPHAGEHPPQIIRRDCHAKRRWRGWQFNQSSSSRATVRLTFTDHWKYSATKSILKPTVLVMLRIDTSCTVYHLC